MLRFSIYGVCLLILLSVGYASQENVVGKEKEALDALTVAEEVIIHAQKASPICGNGTVYNESNETITSNHSEACEWKKDLEYQLEIARNKIAEAKELFPVCDKSKGFNNKPVDCSEVLANGNKQNGIYTIWPRSRQTNGQPIEVFCNMETEGGGWTVIQRRRNISDQEDFYRDWQQYKTGFGDKEKDFWLGNDNIHALTSQSENEIRFDLLDGNGEYGFAHYSSFWIDNEDSGYKLHISNYTGNVGDCMKHHNNMKFSTKDRGSAKYARLYKGGWWYNNWAHSNLNGRFNSGEASIVSIHWWYWRQNRGLSDVEIRIRPR